MSKQYIINVDDKTIVRESVSLFDGQISQKE